MVEYADESVRPRVKHTPVSKWAGGQLEAFLKGLGFVSVDAPDKAGGCVVGLGGCEVDVLIVGAGLKPAPTGHVRGFLDSSLRSE